MIAISLSVFSANRLVSDEIGRLLAELVRTSLEYDLYNARCRGNPASTKVNDSNRLFVSKFSISTNQVINLYIGKDVFAERSAIEQDFLQKISLKGGCKMAKEKGLQKELDQKYRQLIEQISNLP
jgi:hypothetical protein